MPKGQKLRGSEGSLSVRPRRAPSGHWPPLLLHIYGKPGMVQAWPLSRLTRHGFLDFGRPKPANPSCKLNLWNTASPDALSGTPAGRLLLTAQHKAGEAGRAACALKQR